MQQQRAKAKAKAIEVAISSSAAAEFDLIAADAEHRTVLNLFSKRSRQAPNLLLLLYDYKQLTAASTESKPANRLDWAAVAVVGFRSIIATVGERKLNRKQRGDRQTDLNYNYK